MTALDGPHTPVCPACGGSEVYRSTQPTLGRWECHGRACFTWFDGGADEWAKWAEHRAMRDKRRTDGS